MNDICKCQSCGQIACCDSSPSRHASAHARSSGHPIARSAEPGEDWSWCYVDSIAFVLSQPWQSRKRHGVWGKRFRCPVARQLAEGTSTTRASPCTRTA
jgi:hypothetical protein